MTPPGAANDRDQGTLIFAGGGSGGHIFPAIAIAEAARACRPGVGVHVLCSDRAIDRTILEAAGVSYTPVPARPLAMSARGLLTLARSWRPAVQAARAVIRRARDEGPVHVVSTGGFVSVPCVVAARSLGVGVSLVNLDRIPGRANRFVARRAGRVFSAARVEGDNARGWSPREEIEVNPIVRGAVRRFAVEAGSGDQGETGRTIRERLGLAPDARVLAVLGGSQGATSINRLLAHVVQQHADWLEGWTVLHQCGAEQGVAVGVASDRHDGVASLERAYEGAGIPAVVRPFFGDRPGTDTLIMTPSMGEVWTVADLALCRSGAGTVSEVRCAGVPAVFLPYPYHRDHHQRLNAQPIADVGGAVIVTDRIEPVATLAASATELRHVLADANRRASMRGALEAMAPCDGAERIARGVFEVLDGVVGAGENRDRSA